MREGALFRMHERGAILGNTPHCRYLPHLSDTAMPGSTTPPFGEMLRTFRFRAGLSQEALSEAVGRERPHDQRPGTRTTAERASGNRSPAGERARSDQRRASPTAGVGPPCWRSGGYAIRRVSAHRIWVGALDRIDPGARNAARGSCQRARRAHGVAGGANGRDRHADRTRRGRQDTAGHRSRASPGANVCGRGGLRGARNRDAGGARARCDCTGAWHDTAGQRGHRATDGPAGVTRALAGPRQSGAGHRGGAVHRAARRRLSPADGAGHEPSAPARLQ